MLAVRIAQAKAKAPFKLKGLPPREAKNTRNLTRETPDELDKRLGIKIRFDDSGTSPFSSIAESAQAVAINRKITELIRALTLNGVNPVTAQQQADEALRGVSKNVIDQIKETRASGEQALTSIAEDKKRKLEKAEAAAAVVDRLDKLITAVQGDNAGLEAEDEASEQSVAGIKGYFGEPIHDSIYENKQSAGWTKGKPNKGYFGESIDEELLSAKAEVGEVVKKPHLATPAEEFTAASEPFINQTLKEYGPTKFQDKIINADTIEANRLEDMRKRGFINYNKSHGFSVKMIKSKFVELQNTPEFRKAVKNYVYKGIDSDMLKPKPKPTVGP